VHGAGMVGGTLAAMPPATTPSALDAALARVGDRWALLVVDALLGGPRRFGDLQRAVQGIATNVLSARLRQLEREGVVVARPYSQRPPRAAYELTGAGIELGGALRLLAEWGAGAGGEAEPLRHPACGTALEARWYCPTCARTVDDHESEGLRYL
jgi:DNA-binding HxlR family transcriptional regulator